MTEKVVLTKEQAKAIERWADKEQLIIAKVVGLLEHGLDEPLYALTTKELIQALYIGYEVEPEFKVGDWVVHSNGNVIRQIEKVEHDRVNVTDGEDGYVWGISYIRHATPEEISEEKERRWWAKHGREFRQLKQSDLIIDTRTGEVFSLSSIGVRNGFNKFYKVICFAENRLDVK